MKCLKIILLLLLIVCTDCTYNHYYKELINFKSIDNNLIENCERFLVIPSDYCTGCFQDIFNNLEDKQKLEDILFIVIGRNEKEINSFTCRFPRLQYIKEINPKYKALLYPVLYFKTGNGINKIEIVSERDLEKIIRDGENK